MEILRKELNVCDVDFIVYGEVDSNRELYALTEVLLDNCGLECDILHIISLDTKYAIADQFNKTS
jgi:hypothetical protein